jgi:predicted amidohydrolase
VEDGSVHDFRLALVQHKSPLGRKAENLDAAVSWARKARKARADFVFLPELNITGHGGHEIMVSEAEPVPEGPSVARLTETAKDLGLYICAGIAEDDRGIHYNTQFIVGPEGYVGKQRKVHLSLDEYYLFRHGTDVPVFDLPMARVGIIICYDNHIPEIARCLAVKGAEVLLAPHASRFGTWPRGDAARRSAVRKQKDAWRLVHACRAFDNGCYVALCNTVGRSAMGLRGVEANHAGGCMVIDPAGDVVAESRTRDLREEMALANLKAEAVARPRRQRCFNLLTRRPEVFGAITEPTA